MADKEKQIEEMAIVINDCPFIQAPIGCDKHDGSVEIAKYLYNAGYRKQSEGCDFCKVGNEKCVTCVKFFDYYEDGEGNDRCSSEYGNEKCAYYKPVHFCSNCGAKMKGGTE